MEPFLVGILVPLGFFSMIFGIVYLGITSRNRERMALIERGADPTLFETKKKPDEGLSFKWGLFLIGIGLGIVVAYFLSSAGGMEEGASYPAMIAIFGGVALVLSNLWSQKNKTNNELKN